MAFNGRGVALREGWQQGDSSDLVPTITQQTAPGPSPPSSTQAPPILSLQRSGRLGLFDVPDPLPTDLVELLQILIELQQDTRDLIASQIQQGAAYPYPLLVSNTVANYVTISPSVFGVSLTNDGPNTIQYAIPFGAAPNWINLESGEVININFQTAVIGSVGYRYNDFLANPGGSGLLRIVAQY